MRNDFDFAPVGVTARDLEESWKLFIMEALERGRRYEVQSGSRAGDFRLSLDSAYGYIRYPETRPLYPIAKEGQIPPVGTVKVPMSDGKEVEVDGVQYYFDNYVYNPHPPGPNEHYKYSSYLYPLANAIIDYYVQKGFGTAHATMRVGDPMCFMDYFQPHTHEGDRKTTPCLLGIDTAIKIGKYPGSFFLCFWVYYRSWDLFSGYPTNMGGFQLLKEFMAAQIAQGLGEGWKVLPGPTIVSCKDLHIYGADIEAAKAWLQ